MIPCLLYLLFMLCDVQCLTPVLSLSPPCAQSRCRGVPGRSPGNPEPTTTATFSPTSTITPTTPTSPTARPSRKPLRTTPVMLPPTFLHPQSSSCIPLCVSLISSLNRFIYITGPGVISVVKSIFNKKIIKGGLFQ